jgi:hypothetical protein
MIRDLTKSMFSFSWAMSLFGMNQLVNSLAPEKATGAFNAVTRATEEQLGDMLKGAFRAGDQLQRGMVDLTFSLLMLDAFNPSRMTRMASDVTQQGAEAFGRGARMASDVTQQGAEAFGRGAQRGAAGAQERPRGWGPVSPPGAY